MGRLAKRLFKPAALGLLGAGLLFGRAIAQEIVFTDQGIPSAPLTAPGDNGGGSAPGGPAPGGPAPGGQQDGYLFTGELTGFDTMAGDDPAACAQTCRANPSCFYWSFRKHDRACLSYTARAIEGAADACCVSGALDRAADALRLPGEGQGYQELFLYVGELTGLEFMASEDPGLCAAACAADDHCRYWSYRMHDRACLMYTANGIEGRQDPCCISGRLP